MPVTSSKRCLLEGARSVSLGSRDIDERRGNEGSSNEGKEFRHRCGDRQPVMLQSILLCCSSLACLLTTAEVQFDLIKAVPRISQTTRYVQLVVVQRQTGSYTRTIQTTSRLIFGWAKKRELVLLTLRLKSSQLHSASGERYSFSRERDLNLARHHQPERPPSTLYRTLLSLVDLLAYTCAWRSLDALEGCPSANLVFSLPNCQAARARTYDSNTSIALRDCFSDDDYQSVDGGQSKAYEA